MLGGYVVDLKGENVQVQNETFYFAFSSAASAVMTNVSIVDENGAVVAGPVDATSTNQTQGVNFTDTVTYKTGRHVYTVKGKIPSATANNVTIQASTNPAAWTNITGVTSGNTVSFSTQSLFTMNTMTVRAANLVISNSPTPAAQSIVAGAQAVVLANIQFDASQSGEDVRFSSFPATFTFGGLFVAGNLTSCQAWDGTTALNTGSNIVNPTAAGVTFTLDNSVVVTKGTVKTVVISCNISASAAGTVALGVSGANIIAVSSTGVTSSNTVLPTGTGGTGQTMTVGAGSLAVTVDSSSPSFTVAAGGSSGTVLGAYKFRATNDGVNLNRIGLVLTSGAAADLTQVTLWQGATQIGTATFTGGSTHATSSLTSVVPLAKDIDVVIVAKGSIATLGTSQPGVVGDIVKVDVEGNTNTQGTGTGSGNTINATAATGVLGVQIFKSYPIIALDSGLPGTGVADGRLLHLKVKANSTGSVSVDKMTFTVVASVGSASGFQLYAFTDAAYSQPVSQYVAGLVGAVTSGTPLVFTIPIVVPADTTYYFELKATTVSAPTGTSISTTLNGDSSATTTQAVAALASSKFVWSGNSTTTPADVGSPDWSNGFGLPGFTTSNIVNSRSN